jgi:large subunit ribosomal protein L14
MVQHRSKLTVADNTGAKSLYVIQSLGGTKKRFGRLGDTLVCVVRGAVPGGAVSDHEVVKAVLVRTRKETRRPDGSYIKFDDNAAVIVDNEGNPRGTRVVGPVAAEVKDKGFIKIASWAEEVV